MILIRQNITLGNRFYYFRIDKKECENAREASQLFSPIFELITTEMIDKLMKTNMKISFEDAKADYFEKRIEEKKFIDVLLILGFKPLLYYREVIFSKLITYSTFYRSTVKPVLKTTCK